jgi:hypothetical protein
MLSEPFSEFLNFSEIITITIAVLGETEILSLRKEEIVRVIHPIERTTNERTAKGAY